MVRLLYIRNLSPVLQPTKNGQQPDYRASPDFQLFYRLGHPGKKVVILALPIRKRWEQTKTIYHEYGVVNVVFSKKIVFYYPITQIFCNIIYSNGDNKNPA